MQSTTEAKTEYQPRGEFAYIIDFARRARDGVAQMHRDLGHEVIRHYAENNQLWYIVQTDGKPTHLITSGGMTGEGFEYHLPADVNPYSTFEQLRSSAWGCARYF